MTNADYYETRIKMANRKKEQALDKGDNLMAAFYLRAAKGFEMKRNNLTLKELNQIHHEIR